MRSRRGTTSDNKQVLVTYLDELTKHFTNGFAYINLDYSDYLVARNLPKDAHHVMSWIVKHLDWHNSVRRFTLYAVAEHCHITQPRVSLMFKQLEQADMIFRPAGTRGLLYVNPELIYRGKLSEYQYVLDDWRKMHSDQLSETLSTALAR